MSVCIALRMTEAEQGNRVESPTKSWALLVMRAISEVDGRCIAFAVLFVSERRSWLLDVRLGVGKTPCSSKAKASICGLVVDKEDLESRWIWWKIEVGSCKLEEKRGDMLSRGCDALGNARRARALQGRLMRKTDFLGFSMTFSKKGWTTQWSFMAQWSFTLSKYSSTLLRNTRAGSRQRTYTSPYKPSHTWLKSQHQSYLRGCVFMSRTGPITIFCEVVYTPLYIDISTNNEVFNSLSTWRYPPVSLCR